MKKHKAILFTVVLVVCGLLNIIMLCTPVFGSYSRTTENGTTTYTFYENTFSRVSIDNEGDYLSYTNGFYTYIPKDKYPRAEYDTIALESSKLKRDSVFSVRYINSDTEDYVYINHIAIILQVVFGIFIIPSLAYLIYFILKGYSPSELAESTRI